MPYAGPYRPYNAIDVISRAEPSDGIGLGGRVVKERPKKAPDYVSVAEAEVAEAPDCGSGRSGFESRQSPHGLVAQ